MNAHIAPPDPSTRRTSAIDTATAVSSGTTQRIDDFIKRKLSEAVSDDGSGIIDSSARAAQLGFVNAANVRYSAFLEAFRSSPQLTETYRESHPNCLFLPWPAFHAVIKALDLWVDLPEHYMGAVPPEQLPWLEIFEIGEHDLVSQCRQDIEGLMPGCDGMRIESLLRSRIPFQTGSAKDKLDGFWREARDSFFVVAPPEAFRTEEDWLARFRKLAAQVSTALTVAPDDPLVIRFCFGGALVVAAWGDEAAALNEITKELKL